jgi:hypothetical protein
MAFDVGVNAQFANIADSHLDNRFSAIHCDEDRPTRRRTAQINPKCLHAFNHTLDLRKLQGA